METIKEVLPFLIPLILIELGFLFYVIYHILNHDSYKRGTRGVWLLITILGCNFVGPILYLLLGKEED